MTECAMPDFYSEQLVVARKDHRCCETGQIISKGDRYWRLNGKWDGETRTYKQCESAYHFARWLNSQLDGDDCASLGGIGIELSDWPADERAHEVWDDIRKGLREFGPDDTLGRRDND